ncbi:unnamed protein product [Owenia fusiformis]|uniref:Methyltransferase type 11 domain-containing protein n=1 Tax=Owenia fusiformis TaxID=6347 RepID=A0A8S4Q0J7_OWEFU|nr:unnamed protein product [Owenia fusiformis]
MENRCNNTNMLHDNVVKGYKSGDSYNNHRPDYTEETTKFVLNKLNLETEGTYDVLELGAGTGLFTRRFLHYDTSNLKVIATDPLENFLEKLKLLSPDVETLQCSAESIPLPDCSVKNVVCVQCFHWFANKTALKEIHRVMVPHGRLVFLWNTRDVTDASKITYDISNYIQTSVIKDTPTQLKETWIGIFEDFNGFSPIQEHWFLQHFKHSGSVDFIISYLKSLSYISKLEQSEQDNVESKFREIINNHPDTKKGGIIDILFNTEIYWCQKL